MMLIACELDLVVSIAADTGTTQSWLEKHYSDFKVSSKPDPRTGEVLQRDSKEANGQDNWHRASGDYYGNMDAYFIYLNGGAQTNEQLWMLEMYRKALELQKSQWSNGVRRYKKITNN